MPEYETEVSSNETSSYEIEEYEAPQAYDAYNEVEAEDEVEEQEYDNTIDLPVEEESDYANAVCIGKKFKSTYFELFFSV